MCAPHRVHADWYHVPSQVFLLKNYFSPPASHTPERVPDAGQSEQDKRALDVCRNLLTRRGLESTGAVPCVSAECGNWMVPEGTGQRVQCSSCLMEFCRRCVIGLDMGEAWLQLVLT